MTIEAGDVPKARTRYTREFLLKVRHEMAKVTKPELPNMDIVLTFPNVGQNDRPLSAPVVFRPPPTKAVDARLQQQRGKQAQRNWTQPSDDFKRKEVFSIMSMPVHLHRSENAWRGSSKSRVSVGDETRELLKKMKALLNKLTPENFERIVAHVEKLGIDGAEKLDGCIGLFFEKAVTEPSYSPTYARMAQRMAGLTVEVDGGEAVKFRTLLLRKCQSEFERDKSEEAEFSRLAERIQASEDEREKQLLTAERELAILLAKKRSIGNVRFVGELFKLRMISEVIVIHCLAKLLRGQDEESLECLCKLLATIGRSLDETSRQKVDSLFEELEKLIKGKATSSRIRFMIMDVADLRKTNWVPKRNEGPKKLAQVHDDVSKERLKVQAHKVVDAPKLQAHKVVDAPKVQAHKAFDVPNVQAHKVVDAPKVQAHKAFDAPKVQAHKAFDAPKFQALKAFDAPKVQAHKVVDAPKVQAHKTFDAPKERPKVQAWKVVDGPHRPNLVQKPVCESKNAARPNFAVNSKHTGRRQGAQDSAPYENRRGDGGFRVGPNYDSGRKSPNKVDDRPRRSEIQTSPAVKNNNHGRRVVDVSRLSKLLNSNLAKAGPVRSAEDDKKTPEAQTPDAMSRRELELKTKSRIDEYLTLKDVPEALESVKELRTDTCFPNAVRFFYLSVLQNIEKSSVERLGVGELHRHMLDGAVAPPRAYADALIKLSRCACALIVDVPQVWSYLEDFLFPVMAGTVAFKMNLFVERDAVDSELDDDWSEDDDATAKLMVSILNALSKAKGGERAMHFWKESGLRWTPFIKDGNMDKFLKKYLRM